MMLFMKQYNDAGTAVTHASCKDVITKKAKHNKVVLYIIRQFSKNIFGNVTYRIDRLSVASVLIGV